MMFSYRQTRYGLLLAIIAVGAIATIGIATTVDNNAGNNANDLFDQSQNQEDIEILKTDDGGGGPSSGNFLFKTDDGGGGPS